MNKYFEFLDNLARTKYSGHNDMYGGAEITYEEYKVLSVIKEFGIRKTMDIIDKYYGDVL